MTHRITKVTLHRVVVSHRTTWLVCEVTTSEGFVGLGECSDARPIEAAAQLLAAAGAGIAAVDVDGDPEAYEETISASLATTDDPDALFLRRLVLGSVVTALCDVAAQRDGQPLATWLGASLRPDVELYANINRAPVARTSDEFTAVAEDAVAAGFTRIKLAPFDGPALVNDSLLETGIAHLKAVRRSIGMDPTVLVDVHHRLTDDELLPAMRAMEELEIGWVEDAVHARDLAGLERLAAMTSLPLAGGELLTDASDVAALCAGGWLTYLLLDPKYVGGPLRFRSILAATQDVTVTLHEPTGPVSGAVSAHLAMLPDRPGPLEHAFGEPFDRSSLTDPGEQRCGDRLVVRPEPGVGRRLTTASADDHDAQTWTF